MAGSARRPQTCAWCGRDVPEVAIGRQRRYCRQACRQRAYEHRHAIKGSSIPQDAVILTAEEASKLADRAFQVRCAAEDIATAVGEGAQASELGILCQDLLRLAKDAERLR